MSSNKNQPKPALTISEKNKKVEFPLSLKEPDGILDEGRELTQKALKKMSQFQWSKTHQSQKLQKNSQNPSPSQNQSRQSL